MNNIIEKAIIRNEINSNDHYILLTPGPLSTTLSVKNAMLKDWCTWDDDYNNLVQELRTKLLNLSFSGKNIYTTVLMQGSGTFSVESVIGSVIPKQGKLLVITNGAYGDRIIKIAEVLNISVVISRTNELFPPDINDIREKLKDKTISHVALVHVETTTGIKNPLEEIANIVKSYDKIFIVDAMSSFAGIPIDIEKLNIDFLISSANKCIEGVPGFGFIIAKKEKLIQCKGRARSHSLDLYDQWESLEKYNGKWRFTSPTHVVRAFYQALLELEEEGGINQRHLRYKENQKILSDGMKKLGFRQLISDDNQSPIITAFYSPQCENYNFKKFYNSLKNKGFVIYPGKVTLLDTFRIGNIGNIYPDDIKRLLKAVEESIFW